MFSPRGSPWWRSICGGLKGHTQVLGWTPYGGELALFVLGLCPRLPADPHAEEKLERPSYRFLRRQVRWSGISIS